MSWRTCGIPVAGHLPVGLGGVTSQGCAVARSSNSKMGDGCLHERRKWSARFNDLLRSEVCREQVMFRQVSLIV
jgi:hypothetical protein